MGGSARALVVLASLLLAAGCAEPTSCPPADLAPLERTPAFAFVASDYASSAIGLLDADGRLLREAWLDSGTVTPRVETALSGDVVLGSTPLAPCVLTVVERRFHVVTLLDVCTSDASAVVRGQIDVGASFDANPQDVIPIDETRALVSRFDRNLMPEPGPLERGNDLLLVDWQALEILSSIDLGALDTMVGGERAYARPSRMALLSRGDVRRVVVGLARLTGDFQVAGDGAAGVVDLDSMTIEAVPLPGLVNCGELDAVPAHSELAVVTCAGRPFASPEDRQPGAGLAMLELGSGGSVSVRSIWHAADHPGEPVFDAWSVPLSADRIVSVAMGNLVAGMPDRSGIVDPQTESASVMMQAGSAFVLGDGAFDPGAGLLLVPDANEGGVRRVSVEPDGSTSELEVAPTSGCRGLPPREIRRLSTP